MMISRSGGSVRCHDEIRSLRVRLYNLLRQPPEISICLEVFNCRVWAKCRQSEDKSHTMKVLAIIKSDSVWNIV